MKIALLMCTHNGEAYLPVQLDSLLRQTRPFDLIFIHDWGSDDGTVGLLDQFIQRLGAQTLGYLVQHDSAPGATQSFLTAAEDCLKSNCHFDYLFFADQDDSWHPKKLQKYEQVISTRRIKGVDMLYSDASVVTALEGGRIHDSSYGGLSPFSAICSHKLPNDPSVAFANPCIGMTMCISRNLLAICSPYMTSLPWVAHDWALVILATHFQAQIIGIDEVLTDYRQHSGNIIGSPKTKRIRTRAMNVVTHIRKTWLQMNQCILKCPGSEKWQSMSRANVAWIVIKSSFITPLYKPIVAMCFFIFWPRSMK